MTKGKTNRNKISLGPEFFFDTSDLLFHPNNTMAKATLEHVGENFCDKKTNILTDEEDPPVTTERVKKIYVKKKYFKIVQIKEKKRGKRRLKDNSKLHDKFSQYNKICKIGVHFAKTLLEQTNNLYKKYFSEKGNEPEGKGLIPINLKEERNEEGYIEWFFKTVKEFLSSNISGKFKFRDKDFNKKKIEEIIKENKMTDLIKFLRQDIRDVYREYISKEESQNEIFKGLRKFEEDLNIIRKKYEGKEEKEENIINKYLEKIKDIAENLETILSDKKKNKNKGEK